MTLSQLASMILAPTFAVTLTAILRKLAPKIDGPALVWGVAVLLSTIGAVLLALAVPHTAQTIAVAVASGIVSGLMGCGAVQTLQSAAAKGQTPADVPAKLPLDRDTTPTAPPGG